MPVISMSAVESQASVMSGALMTSGRHARQVSHELAALEASMITTGSVGRWLDTLAASSVSTIACAAIEASPEAVIATGVLARDRDGGSAIESHTPASAPGPSPGPAPGGAGGGSSAGAGSGAASSASSILVNALRHAAPSVMLRLYVSQPSWRTSFFALIPARPD
jgi:hypothetical protein